MTEVLLDYTPLEQANLLSRPDWSQGDVDAVEREIALLKNKAMKTGLLLTHPVRLHEQQPPRGNPDGTAAAASAAADTPNASNAGAGGPTTAGANPDENIPETAETIVRFGRFRGYTYGDVLEDRGYSNWILRTDASGDAVSSGLRTLARWLRAQQAKTLAVSPCAEIMGFRFQASQQARQLMGLHHDMEEALRRTLNDRFKWVELRRYYYAVRPDTEE